MERSNVATVSLVSSGAPLLSGDLDECTTPDDESCVGGLATATALTRMLVEREAKSAREYVFIPQLDKSSPFVNMHPLAWVVNRLVLLALFQMTLYISKPSILAQNAVDDGAISQRDISGLQQPSLPLLLSSVAVPPTNSWSSVTEAIHFDAQTQMALLAIDDESDLFTSPQIASATRSLSHIAQINLRNGCRQAMAGDTSVVSYQAYLDDIKMQYNDAFMGEEANKTTTGPCWTSVVLFSDVSSSFDPFLEAVTRHEHPPQLVVYLEDADDVVPFPQKYKNTTVWISQCAIKQTKWCHHQLEFDNEENDDFNVARIRPLKNVTLQSLDMRKLEPELDARIRADPQWRRDIRALRRLADDAKANDPVVGTLSEPLPFVRSGSLRMCKAGECPIGNMYTDALHWRAGADIAFTTSGGYRGTGTKNSTAITISHLYDGLPFPNTMCTGVINGVSVYRLLNYSTSLATFEGENTDNGGFLVQLSYGLRVTYNTEWSVIEDSPVNNTRLMSVDVWNKDSSSYEPLRWTQKYKFATDSFNCAAHAKFPYFVGDALTEDGEEPGAIGDLVIQNIASEYLTQLGGPYNTSIQGRLLNDTSATERLEFALQSECNEADTRWDTQSQSCVSCPTHSNVVFSDSQLTFLVEHGAGRSSATIDSGAVEVINNEARVISKTTGRVLLVNREAYEVVVLLKTHPSWLALSEIQIGGSNETIDSGSALLMPGDSLVMEIEVFPDQLEAGTTALESIRFGIRDTTHFPICASRDTSLVIEMQVHPDQVLNQLGNVRYVGVSLLGLVSVTSLFLASWVSRHRQKRVIRIMQPLFLLTICFGAFILSTTIIPLSLDDEIVSQESCDIACVTTPWLLFVGFTAAFAGLFAKLWRVNRLFNPRNGFQRVVVNASDVVAPFIILFTLNVVLLVVWTAVDPPQWERRSVVGEPWNTYGYCAYGTVGKVMFGLLSTVNIGALFFACLEAYKARDVSEEFSESKYIGVAVYGWFQILAIAFPVVFLIDQDNPTAIYFLKVAVIFIFSLSVLLIIFIPAAVNLRRKQKEEEENGGTAPRRVTISGMDLSRHMAALHSQYEMPTDKHSESHPDP